MSYEDILEEHNITTTKTTIDTIKGLSEREIELLEFRLKEFATSAKNETAILIQGHSLLFNKPEKEIALVTYLAESFNQFTDYLQIAKEFIKIHPLYYDAGKNWWIWDFKRKCYVFTDETDILIAIDNNIKNPSAKANIKSELLEALRRAGRKNKPKDFKPTWVQFKEKIVDFKTGLEFEATPEYFSTNPINWELGEEEDTPTLDRLFEEWVGKDNVLTMYQIIAYCILQDYPVHRIFCFFGEGLNGKSCFLRILKNFIGEQNCTATELELLLNSRFEITRLHKKLACLMTETNFEEMAKTAIIKKLTGQDLIGYEYKNKNPFDDVNYAKILISTNNLPPTTDKTIGFYRRWLIIDFPNRFKEGQDIVGIIPDVEYKNLAKKSIRILKDLIGLGKFHNEGEIEERMKRYEDRSNPFDKFYRENVEESHEDFIGKTEFKRRLEEFCKENRFRTISEISINKRMKDLGIFDGMKDYFQSGERHNFRVWLSIKWKSVTAVTAVTTYPTQSLVCVGKSEPLLHPLQSLQETIETEKV